MIVKDECDVSTIALAMTPRLIVCYFIIPLGIPLSQGSSDDRIASCLVDYGEVKAHRFEARWFQFYGAPEGLQKGITYCLAKMIERRRRVFIQKIVHFLVRRLRL